MTFDLKSYLQECRTFVDAALKESLPAQDIYPPRLHEAMRYSLFAGGKRVRPVLCLAASEACGGSRREVLSVACALEMIHTYSLIHDDLPAMDDDDLRRGHPTNHRVYGDAMAILAGDALYAQAFILLGKLRNSYSKSDRLLEIVYDIAMATGSLGMVGGQAVDIESEGKILNLDELKRIHSYKTGRLITVSITSGAKMVTTDYRLLSALERYGESIGLAFQIADDILDIEGNEELGKDIGSDVERGKATYPALMGLDQAKAKAKAACHEALEALNEFGEEAQALRSVARYIVERKK